MSTLNEVMRHVWTEPRFVAHVEWDELHPGAASQLVEQLGYEAILQFLQGGGWPDPDATVSIAMPDEEPDWDWWEPTSEWRRKAARDREFDAAH